jgi:chorismate mutase
MTRTDVTLDELRRGLNDLDRQLLTLIAERQRVSREVARVKRETGYPTRDYQRERTVILAARQSAAELGVQPALAENLMRMLIRSSLATQEQISVATVVKKGSKILLWISLDMPMPVSVTSMRT